MSLLLAATVGMSTHFDVYPGESCLPTFKAILDRSTLELHRFLESVGVDARPHVHVRLQRHHDHVQLPFSLSDEAKWGKGVYAWFMVGATCGGTDANYDDSPAKIREFLEEELKEPNYRPFEPKIRQAIEIGHCWSFRRSINQPAIINLAYGLIAGCVASLTDGFIDSIDSAWNSDRFRASERLSAMVLPSGFGDRGAVSRMVGTVYRPTVCGTGGQKAVTVVCPRSEYLLPGTCRHILPLQHCAIGPWSRQINPLSRVL